MSLHRADPLDHPDVRNASGIAFVAGYAASVGLMAIALMVTLRHETSYVRFVIAVAILGGLALLAQAVLMFRLDLSSGQRWKTISLLLVVPLFVLSIGLTGWMFHTLYPRTMLDFMQVQGSGM
jgi:cytochrome o ubiquinol oxidase operon protein cyoD